ncbi:hypothetical protein AC579_4970 [Pseudocercospora musae]|uniref:Uncharacterized protein n=1 Tax=Pseudocercospora musae TaxID=113226 RepID=A0A139HKY0_9PEZI|nr:hypothetical protein AC579_4970 [Pseudocercospora musae]
MPNAKQAEQPADSPISRFTIILWAVWLGAIAGWGPGCGEVSKSQFRLQYLRAALVWFLSDSSGVTVTVTVITVTVTTVTVSVTEPDVPQEVAM